MLFRRLSIAKLARAAGWLILTFSCVGVAASPGVARAGEAGKAVAVRLDPARAAALSAAVRQTGMELSAGDLAQIDPKTGLVVLESSGAALSKEELGHLGEWVQGGGALLLTLSKNPGPVAFQLSFLSPTTAWQTQMGSASRGSTRGAVTAGAADEHFFPHGKLGELTLPFHFEIRPWHAVERAEGRYERFARTIPYINLPQTPGETFWTRPLLNRDWRIRLRGDDVHETPLLLTGRYGAGRVAVFASSAEEIDHSPGAAGLWGPTLKWLTEARSATLPAPRVRIAPEIALNAAGRKVNVLVSNPTGSPLPVQIVLRISSWEDALVDDASQEIVVPAGGRSSASFALPGAGLTDYQATAFRDAFSVRVGVLSGDGSTLLGETRSTVDLEPAVALNVATDNIRTVPYPFDAPGYDGQPGSMPFRMGMPVMAYAYPPGKKVNVTVRLANGLKNIAPLARVADEGNPSADVTGLTDGAVNALLKSGADGITADSLWRGTAGRENVLSFTFPTPASVSGVVLNGAPDNVRKMLASNPASVAVEVDGREVARENNLKDRFITDNGLVRLDFPPMAAKVVRLRLTAPVQPILGEVEIEGSLTNPPPTVQGDLSVVLRDAFTGQAFPVGRQALTLARGAAQTLRYAVELPASRGGADFYRVEATFAGQTKSAPLLQVQPTHPLASADAVRPADAPRLDFTVATGFRAIFDLDTGARDAGGSGGRTPADTLIWAYCHNLKQLAANARTAVGRLYASEGNTVYTSTPWRSFSDGVSFYDVATPIFIEKMKKEKTWNDSHIAMLGHGDRWDSGPAVDTLNGWQDYIGFDDYLRSKGHPGLTGKTRQEVSREIHEQHESLWQEWNLERYVTDIRTLHDAFEKDGKDVIIQGQGMPFVPPAYDKPPLTDILRGMSQDSTWELADESVPYTTGFQMAVKAYDPGWKFSTQFVWGYESAVLDNPKWHAAVGTTEPARRNLYDKAFRGSIGDDGVYQSMHTYGYNMNAGVAYTMNANDWQEAWRTQERNSLLTPDGPLGVGLIVGTERYNDPAHALFSGGGMGDDWDHNPARQHVLALANTVRHLQEGGLPVAFAASAGAVSKWGKIAPLVVLNVETLSDTEIAGLRALHARGTPLAALHGPGELSEAAAALFGVARDGQPSTARKVGEWKGQPVVGGAGTLLLPFAAEEINAEAVHTVAALLTDTLQPAVRFSEGTCGYGFTSNQRAFILVEDWREEGRMATVWYRAAGRGAIRAVNVNDHQPLAVRRENADWLIEVPLRPGDGVLVGIEETTLP